MNRTVEIWGIVKKCGELELLVQAAEECAEMAQACCKLMRACEGKTPISEAEARAALIEEIADVQVTALALELGVLTLDERIRKENIENEKVERWKMRIAGQKSAADR